MNLMLPARVAYSAVPNGEGRFAMSKKNRLKQWLLDVGENLFGGFFGGLTIATTLNYWCKLAIGHDPFTFPELAKGSAIFSLFFAYYMGRAEK